MLRVSFFPAPPHRAAALRPQTPHQKPLLDVVGCSRRGSGLVSLPLSSLWRLALISERHLWKMLLWKARDSERALMGSAHLTATRRVLCKILQKLSPDGLNLDSQVSQSDCLLSLITIRLSLFINGFTKTFIRKELSLDTLAVHGINFRHYH